MKKPIKNKRSKTFYLLPRMNFLTGLGSVLNIQGNYFSYNTSLSGAEADGKAIAADWESVGEDIEFAVKEIDVKFSK